MPGPSLEMLNDCSMISFKETDTLGGHWNAFNRSRLTQVIQSLGREGPDYDAIRPPYAVFDWDNSSVFLDVEEATLVYQLQNFVFAATVEELQAALHMGLPQDSQLQDLLADVLESYAWLYDRLGDYGEPGAEQSLHLQSFGCKFLKLYQLLEENYGAELAYPWLPYRFVAMTASQVRELTRKAVLWQLEESIETITWKSPPSLPGRFGPVTVTWRNGLRLLPEMQALYQELRRAGFDVWVCTASFSEGIREVSSAPEFGYHNPPEQVIGMELERDSQGRFLPRRSEDADFTYAKGKTEAIERHLVNRYGYGPALVCGDSNGDADMLVDFLETEISLIIDLKHDSACPIASLVDRARRQRGQEGARFLFQERCESQGCFLP